MSNQGLKIMSQKAGRRVVKQSRYQGRLPGSTAKQLSRYKK